MRSSQMERHRSFTLTQKKCAKQSLSVQRWQHPSDSTQKSVRNSAVLYWISSISHLLSSTTQESKDKTSPVCMIGITFFRKSLKTNKTQVLEGVHGIKIIHVKAPVHMLGVVQENLAEKNTPKICLTIHTRPTLPPVTFIYFFTSEYIWQGTITATGALLIRPFSSVLTSPPKIASSRVSGLNRASPKVCSSSGRILSKTKLKIIGDK